jgi:hypothetical protein
MDQPLILTTLPPTDDRRYLYGYLGQRFLPAQNQARLQPLYAYDGIRGCGTFVLGNDSQNKIDFARNLAIRDLSAGRLVIWIDSTHNQSNLDILHYWAALQLHLPVGVLTTDFSVQNISHTWNPFISTIVEPKKSAELFIEMFEWLGQHSRPRNFQFQIDILETMFRVLESFNKSFHAGDILIFLKNRNAFDWLKDNASEDSEDDIADLEDMIFEDNRFEKKMESLFGLLEKFSDWRFSSYTPSISLQSLMQTGGVLYISLQSEEELMSKALTNLLIRQLESFYEDDSEETPPFKKSISLILNQVAYTFHPSWLRRQIKSRTNQILLTSIQSTIADFRNLDETLPEFLQTKAPNIVLFNPNDSATAEWYVKLWEQKAKNETGLKINNFEAAEVMRLKPRQYLFHTPYFQTSGPILIQGPALPKEISRKDALYHHKHIVTSEMTMQEGIFASRKTEYQSPNKKTKPSELEEQEAEESEEPEKDLDDLKNEHADEEDFDLDDLDLDLDHDEDKSDSTE